MTENIEGKGSLAYQELCRQRISSDPGVQAAGRASKSSSTSSWCEESGTAPSLDISTGHVILNFLQEHLSGSTLYSELASYSISKFIQAEKDWNICNFQIHRKSKPNGSPSRTTETRRRQRSPPTAIQSRIEQSGRTTRTSCQSSRGKRTNNSISTLASSMTMIQGRVFFTSSSSFKEDIPEDSFPE